MFGVGLIAFSLSRVFWLSLLLLPLVGAGFMVQMAATNTILQTHRRRPVPRPRDGVLHDGLSSAPRRSAACSPACSPTASARRRTIALGGAACVVAAVWFHANLPLLRTLIRPIYIERGILPVPVVVDAGQKTL